jgi:hypothetical protein
VLYSVGSPPNNRHPYGDRECCAPAYDRSDTMPQSKPVPIIQFSSPVSLTGAIAASVLLWLLLAWCIWQVCIGLF